ncbi:MAG: SulP family inorganic anion transporter [Chloroflexota bacterium]|nr:SulP family inorganic anion transporter [Chloroflexota bacterium]
MPGLHRRSYFVASLTAAAVIIPQEVAYAAITGLPVETGLDWFEEYPVIVQAACNKLILSGVEDELIFSMQPGES